MCITFSITGRKGHNELNIGSLWDFLLTKRKVLWEFVVRQHLRTGVWVAKLSILWTGKRRRAQAHRFPIEHNVSDLKPSQWPCIHTFFTTKITAWKPRLYHLGLLDTVKLQCTAVLERETMSFTQYLEL